MRAGSIVQRARGRPTDMHVAERRGEAEIVQQPGGHEIVDEEPAEVARQRPLPGGSAGPDDAILFDTIDVGVVVDVREIEKDVDFVGLDAQPLGGRPDLAMIDGRAVGGDAEIPQRLALQGGVARHEADEALLVARAQRLGEGIADDEDILAVLPRLAGRALACPETEPVGPPWIQNVAPHARAVLVGRKIVIVGRRQVSVVVALARRREGPLEAQKHHVGQAEIERQRNRCNDNHLACQSQDFSHRVHCLPRALQRRGFSQEIPIPTLGVKPPGAVATVGHPARKGWHTPDRAGAFRLPVLCLMRALCPIWDDCTTSAALRGGRGTIRPSTSLKRLRRIGVVIARAEIQASSSRAPGGSFGEKFVFRHIA